MNYQRLLATLVLASAAVVSACSKDPEVAKRQFVESGDRFVKEGKLPEAIIEYRNAVQQDPLYGEGRAKLAAALRENNDLRGALAESVRAADILSGDAVAQLEAGKLLLLARLFADAQSRADKALAINPRYTEARILRANALAGLTQIDEAIVDVENAIKTDPDRMASYMSLGAMEILKGDRTAAERAFKQALELDPTSDSAQIALGNFYWGTGRMAEAETYLLNAVKSNPKHRVANRMLAYLHVATNRRAKAETFFKNVAETDTGTDFSGRIALADFYVAEGRLADARNVLDELAKQGDDAFALATLRLAGIGAMSRDAAAAERLVDSVLAKSPKNVDALAAKILLQTTKGQLEGALASAKTAVQAEPSNPRAQLLLGQTSLWLGRGSDAASAFTEALRLNPRLAEAEAGLAEIYLARGRLNEAEQFARAAVAKAPRLLDAHISLARAQLRKGDMAAAEPLIRNLSRAAPRAARTQLLLGQLEVQKRNRAAARSAFQKVLASAPANFDALKGMAQVELDSGNPREAKQLMDRAMAAAPGNFAVLLLAGRVSMLLGDTAAAERQWTQAITAAPDQFEGYLELAAHYVSKGRLDDAVKQFAALEAREPKSVGTQTALGIIYQMQNKLADAKVKYEAALAIDRDAPIAANNLSMIYINEGQNLDMALQLAQTAKSGLPDRPEISHTLGWAYYNKKQYQLAVGPLLDAIKQNDKNPRYYYHLGLAQVGAGDSKAARASLTKALSLSETFDGADDARAKLASLN